jgi:hypothetical protein
MITAPFDVNNNEVRRDFLKHTFMSAMDSLTEQHRSLWGKMGPQQMIEHLIWTFELSTGKYEIDCSRPDTVIERVKKFLYDNRPTPQLFKNPLLEDNPPPLRFAGLGASRTVLREELNRYFEHFEASPMAIHNHPIFGPLGAEDWERTHYKHCFHHLLQFRLLAEGNAEGGVVAVV